MNKYTTKEQQGQHALLKNNNGVICPFTPPYPVQGSMGQLVMQHTNCNTTCPHANFENDIYSITCGCKEVNFKVEVEQKKEDVKSMFSVE